MNWENVVPFMVSGMPGSQSTNRNEISSAKQNSSVYDVVECARFTGNLSLYLASKSGKDWTYEH